MRVEIHIASLESIHEFNYPGRATERTRQKCYPSGVLPHMFILLVGWNCVSVEVRPLVGLGWLKNEYRNFVGMLTDSWRPKFSGGGPGPVPLRAPQMARGLPRDWSQASAVKRRRPTAWAMARLQLRTGSRCWPLVTYIGPADSIHNWAMFKQLQCSPVKYWESLRNVFECN